MLMHLTLALRYFAYMEKQSGKVEGVNAEVLKSKTFDARKAFLNQCSTADPAAISKIMSKFGKVKG